MNVFRPFYFAGQTVPDQFGEATNKYSSDSPWWSAEKIKRLCDLNYRKLAPVVQRVFQEIERDQLEKAEIIEVQALELINKGDEKKAQKILQDFCNENVKRTAKEYKTLTHSLTRMVPVVGIDYLWVDFLQANCKTNALDLPIRRCVNALPYLLKALTKPMSFRANRGFAWQSLSFKNDNSHFVRCSEKGGRQ